MRQRFDPREHLKAVDVRAEAAAAAAAKLVEDMAAGGAGDPAAAGFNQGNGVAAAEESDAKAGDAADGAADADEETAVDAAPKVRLFQCAGGPGLRSFIMYTAHHSATIVASSSSRMSFHPVGLSHSGLCP